MSRIHNNIQFCKASKNTRLGGHPFDFKCTKESSDFIITVTQYNETCLKMKRESKHQMCIHVQLLCTHTCNININTTRKGVSEDMFLWLPVYAHITNYACTYDYLFFFSFFCIVTVFSPFKLDEHNHLSSNFKYGMCLGTNTVLYNSTSSGGGGGGEAFIWTHSFHPYVL